MEDALFFIDNAYLKKISAEFNKLYNTKRYDVKKFAKIICDHLKLDCKRIYFYDAPPYHDFNSTADELNKLNEYNKFITVLKKIDVVVREGRCQKVYLYDNKTKKYYPKYNQKGVDTFLTMDLIIEPAMFNIKNIVLVACDSDFVPVIDYLKECDKKVNLVYYNDYIRGSPFSVSNEIEQTCDFKLLLKKEHFLKSEYQKQTH